MSKREAARRAKQAVEAWARGMQQGGHEVTMEDLSDLFQQAYRHYLPLSA